MKINLFKNYKICSKKDCFLVGRMQQLDFFNKNKTKKDGLCSWCKLCCKEHYKKNQSKWQQVHKYNYDKEKKKEYNKRYFQIHKKEIVAKRKNYQKEYFQTHKEDLVNQHKAYYQQNKEKILVQCAQYKKQKKKEDINYRLVCRLRTRLGDALKGNYKSGSAVADLMMSISDFKVYLEERFYLNPETGEMMTWDNYGLKGWHIDHVIPLSAFDLTNREELLKAVHYSNLRPMWAKQNISEKDRGMSRKKASQEEVLLLEIVEKNIA